MERHETTGLHITVVRAHEDPDRALNDFTSDLDGQRIRLATKIFPGDSDVCVIIRNGTPIEDIRLAFEKIAYMIQSDYPEVLDKENGFRARLISYFVDEMPPDEPSLG